jgi:hypothetical protein
MAASGYTPISLYYSSTPDAEPVPGNLVDGELALNIADGKLFYKDDAGSVQSFKAGFPNYAITQVGNKLIFSYNSTEIASLDQYGNFITLGNVTVSGTP